MSQSSKILDQVKAFRSKYVEYDNVTQQHRFDGKVLQEWTVGILKLGIPESSQSYVYEISPITGNISSDRDFFKLLKNHHDLVPGGCYSRSGAFAHYYKIISEKFTHKAGSGEFNEDTVLLGLETVKMDWLNREESASFKSVLGGLQMTFKARGEKQAEEILQEAISACDQVHPDSIDDIFTALDSIASHATDPLKMQAVGSIFWWMDHDMH